MAGKTVLVLGGGWGGMALAYGLRGMLPSEHRVVVIEKKETFSLCLSNLKIMTGAWKSPAEAERQMSKMSRAGIEWVHEEALRIDPVTREVQTESQTLMGDYLVIALGAGLHPDGVPGFAESAYNLYEATGAHALQQALTEFAAVDDLPLGQHALPLSRSPLRGLLPDGHAISRKGNQAADGDSHSHAGEEAHGRRRPGCWRRPPGHAGRAGDHLRRRPSGFQYRSGIPKDPV